MSSIDGNLPNLIVIGTQKSGTSSLHRYLDLHPDVCMSREKELNFFVQEGNWGRGVTWYKHNFRRPAKIFGESSPNYTNFPFQMGVVERMAALIPDARFIYLLRDPIERILSHYVHLVARDMEPRSLAEALDNLENNHYVTRSMYWMQLEQYLNHFEASRILLLTSQELLTARRATLCRVFRFLQIDDQFDSPSFARLHHPSRLKRHKTRLGRAIERTLGTRIEPRLPPELRWYVRTFLYFPFSNPVVPPILSPGLRLRLSEKLKPDIDRLRSSTGSLFEHWSV